MHGLAQGCWADVGLLQIDMDDDGKIGSWRPGEAGRRGYYAVLDRFRVATMPQSTDPSRDLLFGLLALQTGMIDQGALITAFAAWMRDKARSLADHLVELGHLDARRRAAVEAIAGVHLQALGGDVEKSLAVLAVGRSTRESLVPRGRP